MTELDIPTCVVESMQAPVRSFVDLLQYVGGDRITGLTLFGAITTADFDPKRLSARSVAVMDRVDLPVLQQLAENGAKLGGLSIAAPLVMTPDYITSSLDTFPLEFLEIQQQHAVVFGADHFSELTFKEPDVRLQCERDLKVILIGLRQGLLAAAGRENFLESLETDMALALLRTLRGLLWLRGRRELLPVADVLTEIEAMSGRTLTGVRCAMDATAHHGWAEFEALYRDVEVLGGIADAG